MLIIVAALVSLLLTLVLSIPYLDYLKNNFYGQYIREEAPERHNQKAGTPTMGGIMIVIPSIIGAVLALVMNQKATIPSLIVLVVYGAFMLLGFQDDISKITKKQNKGLSARAKFALQILISLLPVLYVTFSGETSLSLFGFKSVNLAYFYPILATFIITGSSNAVNLTDGLDGLAGGTSAIVFATLSLLCFLTGRIDLAIVSAAIAGSCIGFLYYNKYPAKVFMGDTGSLALGGALGAIAVVGKLELWVALTGLIFVIEAMSVIMQVTSFKTTGKRIFKMSPIHHHFELCGWKEQKVVYSFCGFTLISCITAILLMLHVLKLPG
ncbi:MAG: phospho-N-acetylmuramoyl-pentapeptide-transferase [bacterium]